MHERDALDLEDSFFVDSGIEDRYETAQNYVDGLEHLEGEKVSILADGKVMPSVVVKDGKVTFPDKAKHVIVGLPIEADLQTLPVPLQVSDGGFGQGKMKNVTRLYVRVFRSSALQVGYDFEHLVRDRPRTFESYGTPPALKSAELEVMSGPQWTDSGQVAIRQDMPLPLMVCSITAQIAL